MKNKVHPLMGKMILIREFTLNDYDTVYTLWQNAGDGLGIGRSDTREEIAKSYSAIPICFSSRKMTVILGGVEGSSAQSSAGTMGGAV